MTRLEYRNVEKPRRKLIGYAISLLLALGLLYAQSVKAQSSYAKESLELQVDSLVTALRFQHVESICLVEAYCVGCVGSQVPDASPCATKGLLVPTYIFWQSGLTTYAIYLDNCRTRKVVEVRRARLWQYLMDNRKAIAEAELKHFTVLEAGEPQQVHRNHGGHYSYKFLSGRDTVAQYIDEFDLQKSTKFQRSISKNIYYKQNKKSPIWRMVFWLDVAIAQAEREWGKG